jgi:phosphate transport system substrate-binding protein
MRKLFALVPVAILSAVLPWSGSASLSGAGAVPEAIVVAGSGYTMPRFTARWAEAFRASSGVRVEIERNGTSTGPPALLRGRAQIASMTRPMNGDELEAFRVRLGHEPIGIPVAADALAVFVNQRNPLDRLTIPQIDAIFSSTRACGAERDAAVWGDVGVGGPWADRSIGLYGRRPGSGTGTYFRNVALCGGRFKDWLRINPGGTSAALAIAEAEYGIGFGSFFDRQPGMKALSIAPRKGERYATVAAKDVYSGAYPLGRHLYFYVSQPPGQPLDRALASFIRYSLSEPAQAVVEEMGYLRVPPDVAAETLSSPLMSRTD